MPLLRLFLKAGIDKQNTEYGAEGGWIDGDYIRFRYGLPEKLGGWAWFNDQAQYLIGLISDIITWNDLDGVPRLLVGTNRKLYAFAGGLWTDVTPLRETTTAGAVTFAATDGSNILTVTDTAHGAIRGDFVTYSGAVSLGGNVTATYLNAQFEIQSIIDANSYTIQVGVTANSSDSGTGGASTVGAYQINVGQVDSTQDFGWGVGAWSQSTWGTPRPASAALTLLSRVWQFDNFGEDVVCQLVQGPAYLFDASSPTSRVTLISGAPTKSAFSLVSTPDRHFVCLGTESVIGDPTSQDPMFVRFSNQEDLNTFSESITNTAGGQRLTDGTTIITGIRSRGQILIFTNGALHGMQYVGPPYTFAFQQLGANCDCAGPHAAVDVNGIAYWMGINAFYAFDGTVKKLPCTVQDYVFKDISFRQANKFHAGVNSQFNEVTWWYCSAEATFPDRFVTYNYLENTWHVGTMPRTAWSDIGTYNYPTASEYDNASTQTPVDGTIYGLTAGRSSVYLQEVGVNAADGSAITSYIKSGYFDIGDGDEVMYMKRFIPDFKNQVGDLTVHLLLRYYPQETANPSSLDPYVITPDTNKVDTRARGRQISLRIESDAVDTNWRYGTMRVDLQPDGLR